MRKVDVAILGAGHAGLNALKVVRQVTDDWVLINGGELGTTCARVGCMPSKAIIELAGRCKPVSPATQEGRQEIESLMEQVRDYRDIFVDLVLANTTDNMIEGKELINGYARFVTPNHLEVDGQHIHAHRVIVATGSKPLIPEPWQALGDRVLTSDSLFDLDALPASVAVIGLGYVGLEIGQALHRLGVDVCGFNQDEFIAGISDPVINDEALAIFNREFPVHAGNPARLEATDNGVRVTAGDIVKEVDKVFIAVGRTPNIPAGLESLCRTDERGIPLFEPQTLQVGNLPVYLAGDVNGQRMMLQDAASEGAQAARNVFSRFTSPPVQRVPMSIAFTQPNICHVGARLEQIDQPVIGQQRFGPIGRALIMRSNRGMIRLYACAGSGRLLGAAMIGPRVEHLAHLVAWAIQKQMTVAEMLEMPFYHPVIEEALQDALKETLEQLQQSRPRMMSRLTAYWRD